MSKRQMVTVTVFQDEEDGGVEWPNRQPYTDGSLLAFSAWLAGIVESVPSEFRANARFEISSRSGYEGDHCATIEVRYSRPETDEEMERRTDQERARKLAQEREERALLDALTAKYKS